MGCSLTLLLLLKISPLSKEKWHQKLIFEKRLECRKTEETEHKAKDGVYKGSWLCLGTGGVHCLRSSEGMGCVSPLQEGELCFPLL